MMSRGFRAVSSRLEGKVYETRFTEAQGIQGPEGLVGIAGSSVHSMDGDDRQRTAVW